jgi:hypothetical protein
MEALIQSSQFNITNVYSNFYFEVLSRRDSFHSTMVTVQAVIDHLKRKPDEAVAPSNTVLGHIGTATYNLRMSLAKQKKHARQEESVLQSATAPLSSSSDIIVDDFTILNVLFLAGASRASNDPFAHKIHRKNLAALIRARGGLDQLDRRVKCILLQWESFWTLNTGNEMFPETRPVYTPVYPDFSASHTGPLRTMLAAIPPGFKSLAMEQRLPTDVLEVMSRAVYAQNEQMNHPSRSIVTDAEIFRAEPARHEDFWMACNSLGAPDDVYAKDNGGLTLLLPNLEEIMVLGFLLYCFHSFSKYRAVTGFYNGSRMKVGSDLARRARRSSPSRRILPHTVSLSTAAKQYIATGSSNDEHAATCIEREKDVLLWAYFNLADSWRDALSDKLLPQGMQAMKEIRDRFPFRTQSWESCEEILKPFFWNEAFIRSCRIYWLESEVTRLGQLGCGQE